MRFARSVQFQIKPGKNQEFTRLLNDEVLPTLKRQDGFHEELALLEGERAIGISVWNDQKSAEKYHSTVYPKMLEKLTPVINGTPKVETFGVAATAVAG